MEIFLTLLIKLLPLYALIVLGFFCGRYLKIKKEIIAALLIYGIVPVVIFNGVAHTTITVGTLLIPVVSFLFSSFIAIVSLWIAHFFWKDATKNMFAFLAGSANTGYFGLPVALALFGTSGAGIVSLVLLGTSLYADSLGFFIGTKGNYSTRDSLLKIAKFPMLYAFFLGILASLSQFPLGTEFTHIAHIFNGAFTLFGMMIIGIAIADIKKYSFDINFLGLSLFTKFIVWPLVTIGFILLDKYMLHIFNEFIYNIFILIAFVPVGANMVAYATILKTYPEKASIAVIVSTLLSLFLIPLVAFFFF